MNFYDSIIEGAQELPANERGQLYAAVLEYLYYRREPDFPMRPAPKAIYVSFRPVLDNQLSASERGRKGGRPRKPKSKTKAEVSETQKPNETTAFRDCEENQNQSETTPCEKEKPQLSENEGFSESEQEQEQERCSSSPLRGKDEAHEEEAARFAEWRRQVVAHLNAVTGSHFRPNSSETRKSLDARFREGYTAEDCKRVVDNMAARWLPDPKMREYLRPSTLFRPSKFEGYLYSSPKEAEHAGYGDWEF